MGVNQEESRHTAAMLSQQLELNIPEQQADEDEEADDSLDSLFLVPPTVLSELEGQWCEVFPLEKPFSVHDEPVGEGDAWEDGDEPAWLTFLEDHPAAFDSLEIIDDLVTALMQNHQYETTSLDGTLFLPLLLRAADIIDQALSNTLAPRMIWLFVQNRSALRSLARLVLLHLRSGEETAAMEDLPKVAHYLTAKRVRKPKLDPIT